MDSIRFIEPIALCSMSKFSAAGPGVFDLERLADKFLNSASDMVTNLFCLG
jgi:hypothetical protein